MGNKEIVVSGIRPTGNLHLGNYFGAIKNFVKMQETSQCYFFIADYHSLTTHPTPGDLQKNVKQVLVEYLAAGLDPDKATLYLQSDLPETAELYLFLNMNAYLGELERVTTFKDKARKQPNNVNAGLLTYPTLMAADIIIHKAAKVPVGKDQEQNLEMTRTYARRFNNMYSKDYFPIPNAYNFGEQLVKIPGLDGSGKMGKSEGEGNAIFLNDDPKKLSKKVMRAVTDSGPTEKNQKKPEAIHNLFTLMEVVSKQEVISQFEDMYNDCTIRYGDLKKQLAEDMVTFTEPFREKITELSANEEYIKKVMNQGAEKARESAQKTINEVREIIGFRKYH
ncbi:MAG: tryptophan--tRNA ligase [Bacteroidales bacterium]|jgi:tryptophanyl-tRNA synthetase|nr:tryptophan--tRNA ligase [Lentimicrobiaceae bacterium]MDG1135406.1 tryptophan--tRNA ligase [Bacteroidales bacterium]MDG1902471.1 tryptophan--tRNA ligase [Bacteroidales bacterium]MDG2081941.1 tryptophan--tRNA ligase [Bacteroidales bacterium]|tara:strand:- start:6121 stop:7128 length:1008 start_codon:yes stop_codon:yes gene_type:complete